MKIYTVQPLKSGKLKILTNPLKPELMLHGLRIKNNNYWGVLIKKMFL